MIATISNNDIDFMTELIDSIVDDRSYDLPSDYIEKTRYLPKGLTPRPGFFDFDYTPYLKEPFNLLAPDSGIERIVFMKPAQIGYTVGFLQNAVLYHIGSNPKRVQFVTADNILAEETVKTQINPMIEHSGIEHLIYAQSKPKGGRGTGSTNTMKEYPGGYVRFVGAKNPDSARGRTFERNLYDEIDAWLDDKREGSKIALFDNRSNAFSLTRKSVYGSTPLITQSSKITALYLEGDQRNFFIRCPRCGEQIILKWHGVTEDGFKFGIDFLHEKGLPIYDTVHYNCPICEGQFKNYEKVKFMEPDSCEWISTLPDGQKPLVPRTASFWLNALYSPPGMYPWERIVEDWVKCWDIEKGKIKDIGKYREFRNTKQGLSFEEKGESISYDKAIIHRRGYAIKTIPNILIKKDTGGIGLVVIASIDCQINNLFVDVKIYTSGGRTYTIDFFSIDGPTQTHGSVSWKIAEKFIDEQIYVDEEGRQYKIQNTFIDSSKYTEYVYAFCSQYSVGVYPIKGQRSIDGNITYKSMSKAVVEKSGCTDAFLVNTTRLKDKIAANLQRSEWITDMKQPDWYPNFPEDLKDDYFKQFEAESKVEVRDKITNVWKASYWKAKSGVDNHAFDTYVYNLAALEMLATVICMSDDYLDLESLEWSAFWAYAKTGAFYIDK